MPTPDGDPATPRFVRRHWLRHEILRLSLMGLSHSKIAEHLSDQLRERGQRGIKAARVSAILTEVLAAMAEDDAAAVESIRQQQLARLDRMLLALWPKATDPQHKEHLRAVKEVRELERLRAKLVGTETPQKVEHDHHHDVELFDRGEIDRIEQAWRQSDDPSPVDDGAAIDTTAEELPALPEHVPEPTS